MEHSREFRAAHRNYGPSSNRIKNDLAFSLDDRSLKGSLEGFPYRRRCCCKIMSSGKYINKHNHEHHNNYYNNKNIAMSPTSTITMDITIAVTGRFIKVSAIIIINLFSGSFA